MVKPKSWPWPPGNSALSDNPSPLLFFPSYACFIFFCPVALRTFCVKSVAGVPWGLREYLYLRPAWPLPGRLTSREWGMASWTGKLPRDEGLMRPYRSHLDATWHPETRSMAALVPQISHWHAIWKEIISEGSSQQPRECSTRKGVVCSEYPLHWCCI